MLGREVTYHATLKKNLRSDLIFFRAYKYEDIFCLKRKRLYILFFLALRNLRKAFILWYSMVCHGCYRLVSEACYSRGSNMKNLGIPNIDNNYLDYSVLRYVISENSSVCCYN